MLSKGAVNERNAAYVKICLVVVSYFVVSISMVFLNKVLMTTKGASIPAPFFLTWLQCVLSVIICWLLGYFSKRKMFGIEGYPEQTYDPVIASQVLPLSLIFVGMIGFNQICLFYVAVSFYNVARSLTIVFNVVFTYFFLSQITSMAAIGTLLIVVTGFFVGADGEVEFSLHGTFFGIMSSVFVALNSVYTSRISEVVGNDKWKLSFYNNMNATFLFPVVMYVAGEASILQQNFDILGSKTFWILNILAGLLGFMIGIVTVMQITMTSPLTHNISGTAKACVQTALAFMIWKNPATFGAIVGTGLVLGGSSLYTYVRMKEDVESRIAKEAAAVEDSKKKLLEVRSVGEFSAETEMAPVEEKPDGSK